MNPSLGISLIHKECLYLNPVTSWHKDRKAQPLCLKAGQLQRVIPAQELPVGLSEVFVVQLHRSSVSSSFPFLPFKVLFLKAHKSSACKPPSQGLFPGEPDGHRATTSSAPALPSSNPELREISYHSISPSFEHKLFYLFLDIHQRREHPLPAHFPTLKVPA